MSTVTKSARDSGSMDRGEKVRSKPVARASGIATDLLKSWLRDMLLIREYEVRCMQAYQNKKIGGFCHVYIGQEAVAVGCTAAVKPDDPIVTAYRDLLAA